MLRLVGHGVESTISWHLNFSRRQRHYFFEAVGVDSVHRHEIRMNVILRPWPLLALLLRLLVCGAAFSCRDHDDVGCLVLVQGEAHFVDRTLCDLNLAELLLCQLKDVELAHLLILSVC